MFSSCYSTGRRSRIYSEAPLTPEAKPVCRRPYERERRTWGCYISATSRPEIVCIQGRARTLNEQWGSVRGRAARIAGAAGTGNRLHRVSLSQSHKTAKHQYTAPEALGTTQKRQPVALRFARQTIVRARGVSRELPHNPTTKCARASSQRRKQWQFLGTNLGHSWQYLAIIVNGH